MVQWICEGKSSSCARTHTYGERPPNTTPNLQIVDKEAEAAAKMQRIARAAKTRLIKWKRFTVILWHTHTHTDQNHTKQTIIESKKKGFTKSLLSTLKHTATKKRRKVTLPLLPKSQLPPFVHPLLGVLQKRSIEEWFAKP